MKRVTIAGILVAAIALAGCSADEPAPTQTPDETITTDTGASEDILADYGLDGLTGQEIVDQLEQDPRPRPLPVQASVRHDHVIVSDETRELIVPLDGDEFYMSFAPYQSSTHPCTYHALGGCQGEMIEQSFQVTITAEDGEVLVDEQATTHANGFIGYWLPRDTNATLAVSYEDGTSGEVEIGTFDEDATCVTTIQLT